MWSDQNRQDFEIGGLANRVEALEGVVGQYAYDIQTANQTPRDGQLAFLKADMSTTTRWGDATNIAVNPTDKNGETWPTDEIVTGDVLRFHLKGDITMEVSAFEAKVVQNNNNLFTIDSVVKEVGTIMDGAEYEVFHLSSFDPSGLATMNYVDAQDQSVKDYTDGQIADLQSQIDGVDGEYLTKSGSQELAQETWRLRQPDGSNTMRSFLTIHNGEMSVYHVADPTGAADDAAATKGYADKHVKLNENSDVTGKINLYDPSRLYGKDANGNTKITIFPGGLIETKDGVRSDRDGATKNCYEAKLNGSIKFKVQADGKATSKYEVTSSDSDETLANKKYVDQQILIRPAQLSWIFDGDKGTVNSSPPTRRFALTESSGNKYLRFSFNSNNGASLGDGKFPDTSVDFDDGPVGTIWEYMKNVGKWKLKRQFRVKSWRWNFKPDPSGDAHFEFRMSSSHGHDWSALTENIEYYVTVGGFF